MNDLKTNTLAEPVTPQPTTPVSPAPQPTEELKSPQRRGSSSISAQLMAAQVALGSLQSDDELREALALYGYSEERIRQGRMLLEAVESAMIEQQIRQGDKLNASDALRMAKRQAHDTYMKHVVIARSALKSERGSLQKLDLSSQRRATKAGWLMQARQFYTIALTDAALQARLAEFGISSEKLTEGRRLLEDVDFYTIAQAQTSGAALHATQQRNLALDNLNTWMSAFRVIARVALKGKTRLLEKLGRSGRW